MRFRHCLHPLADVFSSTVVVTIAFHSTAEEGTRYISLQTITARFSALQ